MLQRFQRLGKFLFPIILGATLFFSQSNTHADSKNKEEPQVEVQDFEDFSWKQFRRRLREDLRIIGDKLTTPEGREAYLDGWSEEVGNYTELRINRNLDIGRTIKGDVSEKDAYFLIKQDLARHYFTELPQFHFHSWYNEEERQDILKDFMLDIGKEGISRAIDEQPAYYEVNDIENLVRDVVRFKLFETVKKRCTPQNSEPSELKDIEQKDKREDQETPLTEEVGKSLIKVKDAPFDSKLGIDVNNQGLYFRVKDIPYVQIDRLTLAANDEQADIKGHKKFYLKGIGRIYLRGSCESEYRDIKNVDGTISVTKKWEGYRNPRYRDYRKVGLAKLTFSVKRLGNQDKPREYWVRFVKPFW